MQQNQNTVMKKASGTFDFRKCLMLEIRLIAPTLAGQMEVMYYTAAGTKTSSFIAEQNISFPWEERY